MGLICNFWLRTKLNESLKENLVIVSDYDEWEMVIDEEEPESEFDDITENVFAPMTVRPTRVINNGIRPYEPIRNNLFSVVFPVSEYGIRDFQIKSFTYPTWKHTFGWGEIDISLYGLIGPSTSQTLFHQIRNLENFEIELYLTDLAGVNIQKWTILVEHVVSIDFGGICHRDENSLQELHLVLRPINCILNF